MPLRRHSFCRSLGTEEPRLQGHPPQFVICLDMLLQSLFTMLLLTTPATAVTPNRQNLSRSPSGGTLPLEISLWTYHPLWFGASTTTLLVRSLPLVTYFWSPVPHRARSDSGTFSDDDGVYCVSENTIRTTRTTSGPFIHCSSQTKPHSSI